LSSIKAKVRAISASERTKSAWRTPLPVSLVS
jgi:hypothetical protein